MTRMRVLLVILVLFALPAALHSAELCGDVNDDGINLTVSDIVFLSRYFAGEVELPEPTNADVDLCGDVNIADLSLYLAYFVWGMPWQICVPADQCVQPTGANSVRINCREIYSPDYSDSVGVPIYITTDQQMLGMSLGFHWNSDQINVTSVDTTGTCLPSSHRLQLFSVQSEYYIWPTADTNQVMLLVSQLTSEPGEFIEPQTDGYLATLWFNVIPDPVDEIVDLDSAFFAPAGGFLFASAAGGAIAPTYVDCGTDNIHISNVCGEDNYTSCYPGDANGDGLINITDAVFLIDYIFDGGPANRPYSVCSGDANGDCLAGITDAVYLIQWIFKGGLAPKSCLEYVGSGCDPGSYDPGPWE